MNEDELDGVAGGVTQFGTATPSSPGSGSLSLFDDSTAVGTGDGTISPEQMIKRLAEPPDPA